mmetsp:Transcript_27630/g.67206  ORF Transcript_27630/g.67206 Transcript_27630/m.67206 type:complete len:84 (-) Transcript_27630:86-337(-)
MHHRTETILYRCHPEDMLLELLDTWSLDDSLAKNAVSRENPSLATTNLIILDHDNRDNTEIDCIDMRSKYSTLCTNQGFALKP